VVETAQSGATLFDWLRSRGSLGKFKCSCKHGSANDKGPRIESNWDSVAGLPLGENVPLLFQQDKMFGGHVGACELCECHKIKLGWRSVVGWSCAV
jgi:hypothetical protein